MTPRPGAPRSLSDRGPGPAGADLLVVVALALALAVGAAVWLTGQLAAFIWHRRWPAIGASDVASIVGRLPASMSHPRQAWPAGARSELPAAGGLYLVAVAVLVGAATAVGCGWHLVGRWRLGTRQGPGRRVGARPFWPRPGSPGRTGRVGRAAIGPPSGRPNRLTRLHCSTRPASGADWATRRDLAALRIRRPAQSRLVLGRVGRSLIATEARHSALVLGPTQSGKTTGLAIPALLEWHGPVVATSVKDDLVAHTRAFRSTLGRTWVFDPTAISGAGPSARWSPLVEAATWSGSQRVAAALVDATPAQGGLTDGGFWFAASAKLLAPMLLAARRGGRTMRDVVRWTNLQEVEEVECLLGQAGEADAAVALYASVGRDERIRSSIYTTLETVLASYQDPVVAASADDPDFEPAALFDGCNTLYLCGPAHEQARVQAVFSALVASVVVAAAARYHRLGRPIDPPLLIVLDEAANIAPIKDLDTLASTAAGMGIQLVTVCQDLAQLSNRYGPERARTIANNHRAKIVLSGVADLGTLDTLSGLAGERAVWEETVTDDRGQGRRSTTSSIAYRRLAPADELRRIRPGEGVLIYGHLAPARLALRPWYADARLARLVGCRPAECQVG